MGTRRYFFFTRQHTVLCSFSSIKQNNLHIKRDAMLVVRKKREREQDNSFSFEAHRLPVFVLMG